MKEMHIPFNYPYMTGKELYYIAQAHFNGQLAGDGPFTKRCQNWLTEKLGVSESLLTHSCTAGLEMSALIAGIEPGDEVIVPSFTFVSTANAFAIRGGVPVFVDIRDDTLNMDENRLKEAITERTKIIVPVHYAGVGCEMDKILELAHKYNILVVEDAAQAFLARYKGRQLGSLGDMATLSFHETKNVISGEGGALLVNKKTFMHKAEIVREKGTDRSRFFRGEVDKYTWQDLGSSYLPGELIAAFLWAQLEEAEVINAQRRILWDYYHAALEPLEREGLLRRPIIPDWCEHNAHLYYILLAPNMDRSKVLTSLKEKGISAVFHYVPLHLSPAGRKLGRASGDLKNTESLSARLIRLPVWIGLTEEKQAYICSSLEKIIKS